MNSDKFTFQNHDKNAEIKEHCHAKHFHKVFVLTATRAETYIEIWYCVMETTEIDGKKSYKLGVQIGCEALN